MFNLALCNVGQRFGGGYIHTMANYRITTWRGVKGCIMIWKIDLEKTFDRTLGELRIDV